MADRPGNAPFDRGHVVWHDGLFRDGGRPWVVLSGDDHPFHGREYLVCGVTTTERDHTVALTEDAWLAGGLPRPSFASPWFLSTLKHARIDRGVGGLTDVVIERVATDAAGYLGVARV